jgi:putative transposase
MTPLPDDGVALHAYVLMRTVMVANPWAHAWSSVHSHLDRRMDARITHHAEYLALGRSPRERASAWRDWLMQPPGSDTLDWIRARVASQRALGDERFIAMVERTLNLPAAYRPRCRPRRER